MQSVTDRIIDGLQIGSVAVSRLDDGLDWGVGAIQPQAGLDDADSQQALLTAVVQSLTPVADDELPYSVCTDGRLPVKLLNGEPVPVREQLVGTDTIVFFHMAEALGPRFYKDPNAPLADRLEEVVAFMRDNGLVPCTHVACGAAGGYVPINQHLVQFATDPRFIARQKVLLPAQVYDDALRSEITKGYQDRLQRDAYADWSDTLLMETIKRVSGGRAIAELKDDGRGVHGHVEEQIIRVQIEGVAINEAGVAAATGGREVFGVNDVRMQRLARMLGRGQDEDYKIALMAAEDFTDGGHGVLAKNLPTYVLHRA